MGDFKNELKENTKNGSHMQTKGEHSRVNQAQDGNINL